MYFVEFFFVCFATFMVQNLLARGRKTEKNKEVALLDDAIPTINLPPIDMVAC
jgi:hypothetical protein